MQADVSVRLAKSSLSRLAKATFALYCSGDTVVVAVGRDVRAVGTSELADPEALKCVEDAERCVEEAEVVADDEDVTREDDELVRSELLRDADAEASVALLRNADAEISVALLCGNEVLDVASSDVASVLLVLDDVGRADEVVVCDVLSCIEDASKVVPENELSALVWESCEASVLLVAEGNVLDSVVERVDDECAPPGTNVTVMKPADCSWLTELPGDVSDKSDPSPLAAAALAAEDASSVGTKLGSAVVAADELIEKSVVPAASASGELADKLEVVVVLLSVAPNCLAHFSRESDRGDASRRSNV